MAPCLKSVLTEVWISRTHIKAACNPNTEETDGIPEASYQVRLPGMGEFGFSKRSCQQIKRTQSRKISEIRFRPPYTCVHVHTTPI